MHRLQTLLSLIIFALVLVLTATTGSHQVFADELESIGDAGSGGGPLEPGHLGFIEPHLADIPEPGNVELTLGGNSSTAAGPPEPSNRPHFSGGNTQSIPEPSTRPHFSGGSTQNPSSSNIPEPSTRPHFSGGNPQSIPEPSTRPHFSGGTAPQNVPEPSTSPHFTGGVNTQPQGPPEPSRPHFSPPQPTQRPRNRARPLYTSYYSGSPPMVRDVPRTEPGYTRARYQESEPIAPNYHHLLDHPPLVNQRLDQPFSQAVWKCAIQTNRCFLKNKHNFVKFETQYNFENTPVSLVLDIAAAARKRHDLLRRPNPVYAYNAARLDTTSYFPAQYSDACIAFSYYWNGSARKHLHVLQRNQEDVCIYSDGYDPADPNARGSTSGKWNDIQLQLDLRYGPAKFWIEFQFDLGEKKDYYQEYQNLGYLAIRNFTIGYGTCQNSKAEECDVPSSR